MIHLTIDSRRVEVPEGTMILEAAKQANIHIPTLCYHEDQSVKAVCRICVVEIEGMRTLSTACSTPVGEGMVIHTASSKVLKARKNILELIFARHPQDCLVCSKSGKCELQKVAQDLGMHEPIRYDIQLRSQERDCSSPSIVRNPKKCIVCGRCLETCNEIQGVNVLSKENRGFHTLVAPAYGQVLENTCCINCGQCYQVCPTGAISIHDDTDEIRHQMWLGKKLVIQVAPSVRINLAEAMGEEPGVVSTGRLVSALKRLGFDYVFDSDFSADLTIMEEGTELLHRIQNGGTLPMFTSCCPAWVKYCETYLPNYTDHLSTAKSPQQMFGALIKTWFPKASGIDPADICSISVMPCTAKKYECKRPEMNGNGYQDVDISITVQELANMIRAGGIDFKELPNTPFDDPFGTGSGAGLIFGATGGVMEAALRTVYAVVMGKEMEPLEYTPVRGFEGIKESSVQLGDLTVKVAVAHGIKNARKLIDEIQAGRADYHFVEIMACPGGCIGGGGNAIRTWKIMEQRKKAIYEAERELPIRLSHKNPAITKIYDEYLQEPCGELSHRLLHTTYFNREDLLR
ncbi:MAG: [FeFe] hydrogenase, group A [Lachnospiraceae bacterium]|nr:[FeFe] hydrogenase, group A [Lachnospiraceae bacterium]